MTLHRCGSITPIGPLQTFDVSELSKALHQVASEERVGKVAVTLGNPASLLQVCYKPRDLNKVNDSFPA